jgi:hypothetical protein
METLFLGINIAEWFTGGLITVVAGFVLMFLRKRGFNAKAFFGRAARITEEIGEAFLATSDAFDKADNAIKDNNKLKENSVKDVIAAGKEAVIEWKDVVMVIKPKKGSK